MIIDEHHPHFKQAPILAQNTDKAERKLKLRWILAISCLPLFGIYTAFGIAPQTLTGNVSTAAVIEEITLPQANEALANETSEHFWYKEHVRRDDTLYSLLARLNVRNREAIDYIRNDNIAGAIANNLKPGHQVISQTDSDGNLLTLEYQLDGEQFILVSQGSAGFEATKIEHPLEKRAILKSAQIKSSLFGATDAAGIPDSIAIQVAEIFESEIDFRADLRRGDQFNVIYEGSYDEGELLSTGDVLAVEFVNTAKYCVHLVIKTMWVKCNITPLKVKFYINPFYARL